MSDEEPPPAALAPNWRTVLAVDGLLGVGVFAAGVVLMLRWDLLAGAFIGAAGLTYVTLVLRRYGRWRSARRAVGLDRSPEDSA